MKLFIPKSLQVLGRGLFASTILTACIVNAADTPATSDTTKGSGGSRLSSNTEEADISTSGTATASRPGDAKTFLREAVEGNLAEVALAQVAERKSQNSEVKQFAQMLRQDHEQANQQLQPIAQAHGVAVTQSLNPKHQKKLDQFQNLSGSEFDKQYVTDMLKDHQKEIAKYESASQQVKETDVQQYAQTTLPKLRQHLQHATQTAQAIGIDQSTISSILKRTPGSMGGTGESSSSESGISGRSSDALTPGHQHAPQGTTQNP